ncbi:DUF3540 domain-containing protein, partial [Burkholderia pseudomallei]|uniref:DUF3540 domain-containing protein n=1 Tax=Burkholderia pseudomallei TaxID=28450 RepID=UPI001130F0E2
LADHAGRARRADGRARARDIADSVLILSSAPAGALADAADAAHAPSAFALAVLARAGAPHAALALPGGVVLETGADGLRIDAPHIALAARERIDARAPRVDESAHRARARAARL